MTKVDICNLALTKLGSDPVINLNSGNKAVRCNTVYDPIRREVLRAHTWTFATKISALAELTEDIINYDYVYAYPADCLYISQVFDEAKTDINNYENLLTSDNQKCIASNTYQAYIQYVVDLENTDLFDDIFIEAFAARLAAELAMPIIGDPSMNSKFLQEYQIQISNAKKTNKQEKHTSRNISSPYIEVR